MARKRLDPLEKKTPLTIYLKGEVFEKITKEDARQMAEIEILKQYKKIKP